MSTPDTLTRELAALDDALAGRPVDPDLAALGDLALLLRADRPVPDPAFARRLDVRAERRFPRERARRGGVKWPRIALPALGTVASAALVVLVVISGPTGGGDSGGGTSTTVQKAAPRSAEPSVDDGGGATARGGSEAAPTPGSSGSASTPAGIGPLPEPPVPSAPSTDRRRSRSVERSAELTLAAPPRDIDTAAAGILRVTDQVGGYVASSTVSSGSSGQFELRVPARRLQDALTRLSRVGRVRSRTQSAHDITAVVVSARERLTDARTERRSLLRQLAAADTPNETASIRARLRLVSGQIAAAKRELRRVQTRASYSSVAVTLLADRRAAAGGAGGAWTPGDALDDAVRVLEVTAGVLLVALAVSLPAALLALLAWLATRRGAQRRRERALDAV
ncbi:MAG TPA: DUF4349 domain-containing protein [Solirubrobacteraceae bacterium]|nr:DUF4349 domain-containing protein [Solirubrobacteraceae bacterium]